MSHQPYIYFLRRVGDIGPIKIGCSQKPVVRLQTFAMWSPYDLKILTTAPGTFPLERNLHECFADEHIHHEWFRPCDRLLEGIANVAAGQSIAEAFDLDDRRGSIRTKGRRNIKPWSPGRRQFTGWIFKLSAALRREEKRRGEPLWWPEGVGVYGLRWDYEKELLSPEQEAWLQNAVDNVATLAMARDERWPLRKAA